jgi:hypothetical protein
LGSRAGKLRGLARYGRLRVALVRLSMLSLHKVIHWIPSSSFCISGVLLRPMRCICILSAAFAHLNFFPSI